jgi:hypothetical protein
MSLAGYVFYFLMLALATVYGFLLVLNPKYTISVPEHVWVSEKHWAKVVAWLYAAPVFGMIAVGAMLIPLLHIPYVRYAIGTATFVTMSLSVVGDVRWQSRLGLILDFTTILFLILFLIFA